MINLIKSIIFVLAILLQVSLIAKENDISYYEEIINQKTSFEGNPFNADFKKLESNYFTKGFSDSKYWIKIIPKDAEKDSRFILEIENSSLEHIKIWSIENNVYVSQEYGRFSNDKINQKNSTGKILSSVLASSQDPVFIEFSSNTPINLFFKLNTERGGIHFNKSIFLIRAFFFGLFAVIGFLSLFTFFLIKEKPALFFFLFIIFILFSFMERYDFLPYSISLNKILSTSFFDSLYTLLSIITSFFFGYSIIHDGFTNPRLRLIKFIPIIYLPFIIPMLSDYKFASYFLSSLIILQTIAFVALVFIYFKDTRNLNTLLCASWSLLIFPEIVQIFNYSNNIFVPFIPELSNYLFYGISISIFLLVFFAKKELEFKRIFQLEKNALSSVVMTNDRKEKFIKMIIERLMTPIDTISELSKDLIEKRDDIEISEYNAKIRSLLKRSKILGNLIHDIRDYDQIEHGELLLNLNKFDLYSLVTSSILAIQPSIVHRNIIIVNNVNNKLPFIEADEKRIKQVVLNFLNTIIQNMVEGTININAGEKGNQVLFSIDFDDPGIELDVLNAFFVPYDYLVQTEDGHLFGSNLYVSKKIIQMHGGHVKLEKKNGRIRFYFILKILENQNEIGNFIDVFKRNWSEYYISDSPLSMSRTGVSFGLIFVIDDDITILENITGFLESVGYEIRAFQNPKNVIEAINENKPDLIITDTIMPYMSGYELCIQIRKIFTEAELPILLLATFDKTDELMVSIDSGVNDYITKPVSREQLLARVKLTINLSNITRAYERFVPSEFIRLINKNSIAEIKLGDHVERELTILFSDIRAFTHISEKMTAQENFSFLNSYLNKVGPVIRNNNGFIDKYIGDAIMALFSGTADDAVNAAIEMQRKIREHNYINKSNNEQIIRVGIGIHTGNVIIGTIGENQRMEGTVVSDAVNLTSRLENLTKLYGCNILISMDTFLNLEDSEKFNYRILDRVKVKGKEKFITVIEIIDGYSQTKVKKLLDSKIHFEEGIAHYLSREFDAAIAKFKKVLSIIADDEASIIYIQRSEYYKNHVLPKNWDGVEILEEKFY